MNLKKDKMSKIDLLLGDCLELMKSIPDGSVDAIICDLPYGTTNCKWDSVIDLPKLWIQYNRIIKPNGAIVLTAQTPFDKVLGCSNLSMLKYEWIWEKTQATGHLNAKKMPMKAHENILVFYKKLPTYNPQKTKGHKPINSYTKYVETQNNTEIYGKMKQEMSGGGETDRYPRSVITFSSDKQKSKLHSTQKPLALMEYLVKTYTNEGETVLDSTMGSGTTMVACKNLNRNGIGIEMDEKYFEIATKRLNE
jgi:site-specific DNA-methyltransferase (adenine-specific)